MSARKPYPDDPSTLYDEQPARPVEPVMSVFDLPHRYVGGFVDNDTCCLIGCSKPLNDTIHQPDTARPSPRVCADCGTSLIVRHARQPQNHRARLANEPPPYDPDVDDSNEDDWFQLDTARPVEPPGHDRDCVAWNEHHCSCGFAAWGQPDIAAGAPTDE